MFNKYEVGATRKTSVVITNVLKPNWIGPLAWFNSPFELKEALNQAWTKLTDGQTVELANQLV